MKFDQYAQEANTFVREVAAEMGNPSDTDQAYRITVAVLHTIRKILTPEESLHLVSQLPMYLKAEYVNGWKLPVKDRIRSMEEFLQCVRSNNDRTAAKDFGNDAMAKERVKAVLSVLQRHVTVGELMDVLDQFPTELLELWGTVKEQA
jgi:uncharacterized protein (DUF2267 family)